MMVVSFRDSFPDSVAVLISVRAKEPKSPINLTWMHTLEVNSLFLDHLDLYSYKTIEMVKDSIQKFATSQLIVEVLKNVPLVRDERMLFRLAEPAEVPCSPSKKQSLAIRGIHSVRPSGEGDDSEYGSEYLETSSR